MTAKDNASIAAELDRLVAAFFSAVSFETGSAPTYDAIRDLFIAQGLLIKNVSSTPEICSIDTFIAPRRALVASGALTRFNEVELSHTNDIFGNVAQRLSVYAKSGVQNGTAFEARGVTFTQFISTPEGWRISAMAWDDERPGLVVPSSAEQAQLRFGLLGRRS